MLHPDCRDIFRRRTEQDPIGRELTLHRHQTDAIEVAQPRRVLRPDHRHRARASRWPTSSRSSTGCCARVPAAGVRAIVVYPMNALANSQLGELEKFLGDRPAPKVTFARYTGQESRSEREAILQPAGHPADQLRDAGADAHPAAGARRRSSRRPRTCRSSSSTSCTPTAAARAPTSPCWSAGCAGGPARRRLQCIGTSATLAGPGTRAEQRAEVAAWPPGSSARRSQPTNVVGETLRRATSGDTDPTQPRDRLTASEPRPSWDALRSDDPFAIWIEQTFGLRNDDEGRLARQAADAAATAAARARRADRRRPTARLRGRDSRDLCSPGREPATATGRPLFAFKLHQFIGKGDTVYVTLEPAAERYLTTQYQRSAPDRAAGQPLFPLAFCRECGQEYPGRQPRAAAARSSRPRVLNGGSR